MTRLIDALRKRPIPGFTLFLVGALTFGVPAVAQLETRVTVPVLPSPVWIAVADFNHDGRPDVAVASHLVTNQVTILLGKGDGTFQSPVNYTVGDLPDSVVVGDFNRDGNPDLAVANSTTTGSSISILLGNGDGTFQPAVNYPMPQFPGHLHVGDFNNDHKLDLITLESAGSNPGISVLLGNGDGTFQAPINTPEDAISIGIGDFNRDGKLDVAATSGFGSTVDILVGNGDGTFTFSSTYPVGSDPEEIAVADLNQDGDLDLVVAAFQGVALSVLLGNGDGTFQPAVGYPTPFPLSVAVADFNGDGKLDLVAANFSTLTDATKGNVSVLLGNGDGTFQPGVTYPVGPEPWFVATGDFNGDHKPDVVVAEYLDNNISVLLNTGVVAFSPTTPLDFHSPLVGSTRTLSVALTNQGTKVLTISSMTIQSPFTMSSTCGKSLPAKAACGIKVAFSPISIATQQGVISISDSASTKPQVIELTGSGTVVELLPVTLSLGSQKVGTSSPSQQVQLINHGQETLSIHDISITGKNPGDFFEDNTCVGQVKAGGSCVISVTFKPQAKGSRSASISITDNGGGSPQKIPVSGTGI